MTKKKIWFIIGASLVLFSSLAFVIVMSFAGWDFSKLATVKYETREVEISDSFNKISISLDTADLVLLPSEDEKCKIVATEQEKLTHLVTVEENTLKIKSSDTFNWYDKIHLFNFGSNKITVYLPKQSFESLNISTSTGNINVPQDFSFRSIDIEVSTADVDCSASSTGSLKIKNTTGNVFVNGIFYASVDLSVSTGDIKLLDATCVGDVTLKVGTGNATVSNVTCTNFTLDGSTSDVKLSTVLSSGKMNVKTGTGSITLLGCNASEFDFKATTGDITGSLRSSKVFDAHATTGDVSVPPNVEGAGLCKIRTSTGNIKITIG